MAAQMQSLHRVCKQEMTSKSYCEKLIRVSMLQIGLLLDYLIRWKDLFYKERVGGNELTVLLAKLLGQFRSRLISL